MAVGAELPTLAALFTTFNVNAEAADTIKAQVDTGVANAVWEGRYAEEFRTAWEDYRKNLDTLREALAGAALDVQAHHNNTAEAAGEPDRI